MRTQRERILSHLRMQKRATVHDLIMVSGGNSPWKRIDEMTDDNGLVYEPIRDGWVCTGEKIVRDRMKHKGRWITVFVLYRW